MRKNVIFIDQEAALKRQLLSLANTAGPRRRYVLLSEPQPKLERGLADAGFVGAQTPELLKDPRRFVQAYIDVIGLLGRQQNKLEWWATDIASKNRFNTKLPELLEQFLKAADAIARESADCLLVVGAPWPLRSSLEKLASLGAGAGLQIQRALQRLGLWVRGFCRRVIVVVYHAFLTWRKGRLARRCLTTKVQALDRSRRWYVVKTFFYDHSFTKAGQYQDAFFGPLPDFLKNRKNVLIVGTVLGDFGTCLKGISAGQGTTPIVPIEYFIGLKDLIAACLRLILFRARVQGPVDFAGYDVGEVVSQELLRSFFKVQPYQYFHYAGAARLAQTFPVETFLMTYENNPWEKMCTAAFRRFSPSTVVLGYQHTVVPQSSANMFASEREANTVPDVDRIITVGEIPKEIIGRYRTSDKVIVSEGCALRYEYLKDQPAAAPGRGGRILVVLEGIYDVYRMVNYVLEQLKEEAAWEVVIRTHPVLPLERIRSQLRVDPNSLAHVKISRNLQVKADIEWADIVIYWGTTVALEALSLGKPLIHFDMGGVLSYDPLFECPHLKWKVTPNDSLPQRIREIFALPREEFCRQQAQAKAYMERYFHPVSEAGLAKFLG